MNGKIKLSIFIVTLVLAIAATVWGITSYVSIKFCTFKGTVTSVHFINNENGVDIDAVIIYVRDNKQAKVFELVPSSTVLNTSGEKTFFYGIGANQKVTIKYDSTVSASHSPAEYVVKTARITEIKSYNIDQYASTTSSGD